METLLLLLLLLPFGAAHISLLLRNRRTPQFIIAGLFLLCSSAISVFLLYQLVQTPTAIVAPLGGWQIPFGIVFVLDPLSAFFVCMSHLVLLSALGYSWSCKERSVQLSTYVPMFLLLGTGLTGTLITGDLFTLFVFIELMVITASVLTALSDSRFGLEAAYKYFMLSLLASAVLLIAIGTLYAAYGTLNLANLAQNIHSQPIGYLGWVGLACLFATFMLKSATVPFHIWQPDFHTVAPTPISSILSSIIVKMGVYGFLRLTTLLFASESERIRLLLMVLGILSIWYGSLGAYGTHNAKRMLAYSTISQVGFLLVGIGWGTYWSLVAVLVFAFNHALIKSAMFMLTGVLASRMPNKSVDFADIQGMGKGVPQIGLLFFVGAVALSGFPPLNGFPGKFLLFWSGWQTQQLWVLALVAGGSVLTSLYLLRAFIRIWWEPTEGNIKLKNTGDALFAPIVLLVLCVMLGVWAQLLFSTATHIVTWLIQPDLYISAVLSGG
jgi:multicomponent Na+:H+ antiporter subunit D